MPAHHRCLAQPFHGPNAQHFRFWWKRQKVSDHAVRLHESVGSVSRHRRLWLPKSSARRQRRQWYDRPDMASTYAGWYTQRSGDANGSARHGRGRTGAFGSQRVESLVGGERWRRTATATTPGCSKDGLGCCERGQKVEKEQESKLDRGCKMRCIAGPPDACPHLRVPRQSTLDLPRFVNKSIQMTRILLEVHRVSTAPTTPTPPSGATHHAAELASLVQQWKHKLDSFKGCEADERETQEPGPGLARWWSVRHQCGCPVGLQAAAAAKAEPIAAVHLCACDEFAHVHRQVGLEQQNAGHALGGRD